MRARQVACTVRCAIRFDSCYGVLVLGREDLRHLVETAMFLRVWEGLCVKESVAPHALGKLSRTRRAPVPARSENPTLHGVRSCSSE